MSSNRINKKIRKTARTETKRHLDNIHKANFFTRFKFAVKMLFGRKLNNGKI